MNRSEMSDEQWRAVMRVVGILETAGFSPASGPVADLAQAIVESVCVDVQAWLREHVEVATGGVRSLWDFQEVFGLPCERHPLWRPAGT